MGVIRSIGFKNSSPAEAGQLDLLTFEAAAESARTSGRLPHVLLGNGFSRACRNDIFAYGALFDRADFRGLSHRVQEAFPALGTTDFEAVMRALRQASVLMGLYGGTLEIARHLQRDAEGLREVLVRAIADSHPSAPQEITPQQYGACKRFLSNFNRIFTVNYDLLLYWALMQSEVEPDVRSDDGFRSPDDEAAEYVTWEPENVYDQNVYFLHGGLHLFDAGPELRKFTWARTQVRLIDQVRDALARNMYPLFVAEGTSDQKLNRIRHHAYLSKAERSLVALGGGLFIYGLSFSESDDHILRAILASKLSALYVSIFGNPDSEANRVIAMRAASLADLRPKGKPVKVHFFDALSAAPWG